MILVGLFLDFFNNFVYSCIWQMPWAIRVDMICDVMHGLRGCELERLDRSVCT